VKKGTKAGKNSKIIALYPCAVNQQIGKNLRRSVNWIILELKKQQGNIRKNINQNG
jgi:hypothetical protein